IRPVQHPTRSRRAPGAALASDRSFYSPHEAAGRLPPHGRRTVVWKGRPRRSPGGNSDESPVLQRGNAMIGGAMTNSGARDTWLHADTAKFMPAVAGPKKAGRRVG